jgi:hypothetical protein
LGFFPFLKINTLSKYLIGGKDRDTFASKNKISYFETDLQKLKKLLKDCDRLGE